MTGFECCSRKDGDQLKNPNGNSKNKKSEKKMLCGESLKALSLEEEGGGRVLFSPLNVALTMVVINVSAGGRVQEGVFLTFSRGA